MAEPSSSNGSALLSVRDVSVRFGGIVALDGVSFDVFTGQIAGLIGPNGAGKTTLFNCLSRLYTPNSGEVLFEGKSILGRPRHDIPHIGIGRTFQNVALFDRMTVLDNVKVGCHSVSSTSFFDNALQLPKVRVEEERITPRWAMSAGCSRVTSMPLNRIIPVVGVRNLVNRLNTVVLPAPLGPIRAWMWPRST